MSVAYSNNLLPLDPDSRWIRVFDLQPMSYGNEKDQICGQLRAVNLDDSPSYSALSYAWGSLAPSYQIVCKTGESLSVTENCYDALRHLRHSFHSRTLWVDSICIDQANEDEKSHEVSLMRDVYSQAEKVYIWLGRGTMHSDQAIDWLENATSTFSPILAARVAPFPEFLRPRDVWKLLRMMLESARIAMYSKTVTLAYDAEAMKDITSRDWFRRVWTIQEVVMAREPIVICGGRSIRWSKLFGGICSAKNIAKNEVEDGDLSEVFDSVVVAHALWLDHHIISEWSEAPIAKWLLRGNSQDSFTVRRHFLKFLSDRGSILGKSQIAVICLTILTRMCYGLRPFDSWWLLLLLLSTITTLFMTPARIIKDHDRGLRSNLVGILNKTRRRQATKRVDRVFALYGIFQKFGIPLQKPDYGKSVGEVYCEFTRSMINWHKSLNILTEVSTPPLQETPSWVPDWSVRYQRIHKGDSSAAGGSLVRYEFSDCGRALQTSGTLVDHVMYCSRISKESSDSLFGLDRRSIDPASLSRYLENMKAYMGWISYALRTSNQRNELLLEGLFECIHSVTDFEAKDKSCLRQTFDEWYAALIADYSDCNMLCSPTIACALAMSVNNSLNRYHYERCREVADRTLFVTLNGKIGIGPAHMLNFDKVVIISGLRTPLILREARSHYEVVGATYIHGIMNGEVWPENESELQQVTLI